MSSPSTAVGSPKLLPRVVIALLVTVVAVIGFLLSKDHLTLENLADHETALRDFQQQRPWLVASAAIGLYIVIAGFSIPLATVLTLSYAWYFGFWKALVIVSFGSTAGATVALLISRFIFRELFERKFHHYLKPFNTALEREGAFYLLSLRLLPVVPFFVVNAVMGLTSIRIRTFWWASQLGMLPGTLVFVYAGSTAPSLRTLADQGIQQLPWGRIMVALTLLGLLPLVSKWLLSKFRTAPLNDPSASQD